MKNIDNIKVESGYAILTKDRAKGLVAHRHTVYEWVYALTDNPEKVTVFKPEFSAQNIKQRYLDTHKEVDIELEVVPVKVMAKHQVTLEEVAREEQIGGGDN